MESNDMAKQNGVITTRVSTFDGREGKGEYLTAKQLVAIRPVVVERNSRRIPAHIRTKTRRPQRKTLSQEWCFLIQWNETMEQTWCEEKFLEKYVGQEIVNDAQVWKLRYYMYREKPIHPDYGPLFFEQHVWM